MSDLRWYIDKAGKSTLQQKASHGFIDREWKDVPVVSDYIEKGIDIKSWQDWLKELKMSEIGIVPPTKVEREFIKSRNNAREILKGLIGDKTEDPELYTEPRHILEQDQENHLELDNIATINIRFENSINDYIELWAFINANSGKIEIAQGSLNLDIVNKNIGIDEHWDGAPFVEKFLKLVNKHRYSPKLKDKLKKYFDVNNDDKTLLQYIYDEKIDDLVSIYNDGIKCGFFLPKKEKSEPQD